jgi:hypothetical protein
MCIGFWVVLFDSVSAGSAGRVREGAGFEKDEIWLTRVGLVRGDCPPVGVREGEDEGSNARPELMAIEVCTHRRKGELCRMTLYRRLLRGVWLIAAAASSSVSRSCIMDAMRAPTILDCSHPP